jgi:seryl-tRNA synthetase
LKDTEKLLQTLKLPYKVLKLSTEGYTFEVKCAQKGDIQEESPYLKQSSTQTPQPKQSSKILPIDRVIRDIELAIKDAQKIGTEEPEDIRTIYQLEFDKERLIRDLQTILKGLENFKKQVELEGEL